MQLPNFTDFEAFNELRATMGATRLGFFELFDPEIHLTGEERSALASGGIMRRLEDIRVLPDKTLAIKNSRVLIYIPDENWYRSRREYPVYHLARCSELEELSAEQPDIEYLATTRQAEDYDLVKIRPSGEVGVVSHGFVVCKHCLHQLRYKDFDAFRNRKRGYSQKVLTDFRLSEFYHLYQQYPLSFRARRESESQDS